MMIFYLIPTVTPLVDIKGHPEERVEEMYLTLLNLVIKKKLKQIFEGLFLSRYPPPK